MNLSTDIAQWSCFNILHSKIRTRLPKLEKLQRLDVEMSERPASLGFIAAQLRPSSESPWTSRHYSIEGFVGGSKLSPHNVELSNF